MYMDICIIFFLFLSVHILPPPLSLSHSCSDCSLSLHSTWTAKGDSISVYPSSSCCSSGEMILQSNQSVNLHQKIGFYAEATKLGRKREHFANPFIFTSEQICTITDKFDNRNLIGPTQFGKVYRGKICEGVSGSKTQNVIVKIWDEKSDDLVGHDDYLMVEEEEMFLTDASVVDHPNLVNLIGYCCEEQVRAVVYDLDPLDTLHNMMLKDDFNWLWRIKVALGIARLLDFLHGQNKPYLIFNIDACHIMVDQEFNPIVFDFGLMSGGLIGEMSYPKQFIYMSLGYVDPFFVNRGLPRGLFCDVFSYGVILVELIAKIAIDKEKLRSIRDLPDEWARSVYKPGCSLVEKSLEKDAGYHATDGPIITKLAMHCVEYHPKDRPTMKEVVEQLQSLQVVQLHGDEQKKKTFMLMH